MEPWQILILTLAGVIAGWINVMAGGGSMLTVPIMLFMGIPGPVANGTNRIAIVIPCHRVVAAGGNLGGYGYGAAMKRAMLTHEGAAL